MIEYANHQIRVIEKSVKAGMDEKAANEFIRRIDRAVRLYENGMITIDETMKILTCTD